MIKAFYQVDGGITTVKGLENVMQLNLNSILWLDLFSATAEEKDATEKMFGTELFTRQEAEEIESSSKYSEDANEINVNTNFLINSGNEFLKEPLSIILKNNCMISQRDKDLKSLKETEKRIRSFREMNGYKIFITLLEIKIDYDADFIEAIAFEISRISKELTRERRTETEQLIFINELQEKTMQLRENIVEKQRILSSVLKSEFFPKDSTERLRIMIKDVGSLLDHSAFNFERLEYLQNTFLGLVDIEQNRIIKIFTVVTVVFMPPTLIASLYGMNFKYMPELSLKYGYPLALLLMVLSSIVTLLFFKKKNWL